MSKTDPPRIPALYFDAEGRGPDHVYLEPFPIRSDDVMPAALSLRVRAGEFVMRAQVDGGYFMQREQVAELHRALGEWLVRSGSSS